ncbi:hypothetical protein [Deinococcus misasensis]|uniref:hypothetical protein n=1 Tax=Deinococcus misasensis TaxID=392413 RepID=UPI0005590F02|nr:hypothetical protein [Deinococcus misasensis]
MRLTFDLVELALRRGQGHALMFLEHHPSEQAHELVLQALPKSSVLDVALEKLGSVYLLETRLERNTDLRKTAAFHLEQTRSDGETG